MADYREAILIVIEDEGGYVNDPDDVGGETKYGISKLAYPDLDIKNVSLEDAMIIYKEDYWNRVRGDSIDDQPMANALLGCAVNIGVRRASKLMQQASGAKEDGVIGPMSIGCMNYEVWEGARERFIINWLKFYRRKVAVEPSRRKYFFGWVSRVLRYA